jgi:hypothetical protein
MIQCSDCELCEITPQGQKTFKCDPFNNIKEPECIAKWQLLRLDMILVSYRNLLGWYEKMGPMQKKIFKYVQRELDDIEESDSWKIDDNDENIDDDLDSRDDYFPQ